MSANDIKLSKSVRYSRTQMLLFSFLPKDGTRITSTQLMKRLMSRRKKMNKAEIDHPRNLVITTMRHGLIKKVNAHETGFKICLTPQSGPYPIEYWIERRKKRDDGHAAQISATRRRSGLSADSPRAA